MIDLIVLSEPPLSFVICETVVWEPRNLEKSTEHSRVVYLGISVYFLLNVPESKMLLSTGL